MERRPVFLSYGHDEYVGLALRLRDDLRALGHRVWFDEERLQTGVDWEGRIEQGLEEVANSAGCVVLLMTPHSVRRPGGYCLNELSRAVDLRLDVLPVMVADCVRPLSIYRIQYLDMRDCVDDQGPSYASRFARLLASLERGVPLDAEGGQGRLLAALQPLGFDADVQYHLGRFVGRRWVTDRIGEWLSEPGASRIFWITGPPGVGKTALAGWLARYREEVAAFHLCRYGDTEKADPRRCVMSIAYQLSTQLPEYERRLQELPLEAIVAQQLNAATLFDRLIVQPLWRAFPTPKRPTVVLIDGLDEATSSGRNELADFLAAHVPKTPAWMRLIITSRLVEEVTAPLAAYDTFALEASAPENAADLRTYLSIELAPFCGGTTPPDTTLDSVLERSEGSFLYASWIREELACGRLTLERLDRFPRGLGSVYREFFSRRFGDLPEYRRATRPVLQLVAAAREPLPIAVLAEHLRLGRQEIEDVLQAAGSLFVRRDDILRPFHRSVMEWLTEPGSGAYFVSEEDGHRALANEGWTLFERGGLTPYFVRQLPHHLAQMQDWERLERLLCDPSVFDLAWHADRMYDWIRHWRLLDEGKNAGIRYSASLQELETSGADGARLAVLSDRIGWLLCEMAYDLQARPFLERALAWRQEHLPAEHPDVAGSLHRLAELLRRERDFEAARPLYERALTIRRAAGADSLEVAASLHGLGEFHHDQGEYAEAQRCYEEALSIRERRLPAADPDIATCLNDLGALHNEQGQRQKALPLYERAERIYRLAYGSDHPDTAAAHFGMAMINEEEGQLAQAWPLYLRALDVHERIFPVHHHKVARARGAALKCLAKLDATQACEAWRLLVETRERAYGRRHIETARTLEAAAWHLLGPSAEAALAMARRAVEIQETASGPGTSATATALNTLVRCLQVAKRFSEAVPHARRALAIREHSPEIPPSDLATSLNNLGLLLVELGQLPEAESVLRRCLEVDPTAPFADYWLGRLYEKRGQAGDTALEADAWRNFLRRGDPHAERRAYAERRIRQIETDHQGSQS